MYCIKCGAELEEGSKFCTFCGADQEAVSYEEPSQKKSEQAVEEKPAVKSGKSKTIIIIAVLAVIAAIIVFAVVTLSGNENADDNTAINEDTQTTQDIADDDDDDVVESDEPEADNSKDATTTDKESKSPNVAKTDDEIINEVYKYAMKNQSYPDEDGCSYERSEGEMYVEYSTGDACVVTIPVMAYYYGEPDIGWCDLYWFSKKTGEIKYLTGAQDFQKDWVDMKTGKYIGPKEGY